MFLLKPIKAHLSNLLAVAGAVALVVGVGMFRLAAGVIALGILLVLGAVATAKPADPKPDKQTPNPLPGRAVAEAFKKAMN